MMELDEDTLLELLNPPELSEGRLPDSSDPPDRDGFHLVLCNDCMQAGATLRTLEWLKSHG